MKIKALVAACAMAFAGQAMALSPSVIQADITAGTAVQIKLSGSSALQNAISEVGEDLCQTGTIDEYWDGTATTASGSNYRAVACTAKASGTVAGVAIPSDVQGKPLLIYDTAKGGSIYGVNPVATATATGFVDITTCGAASVTTNSLTHEPVWSCTGSVSLVPDAGISDVEPATLEAPINLTKVAGVPVFSALTAAQMATLTSKAVVGQVMGIVVNGTTAMGSASPATTAMLNMSKSQVAAIMDGTTYDWNTVDSNVTAGSSIMVICRRQSGSGSQASINANIMGNPCMKTALNPLGYADSSLANGMNGAMAAASDIVVVENSSTGNLAHCMTYAQKGGVSGSYAGEYIDLTTGNISATSNATSVQLPGAATTPTYAIGVVGLDHGVGSDWYQNTVLNGTAASTANASTGQYDLAIESTFNKGAALTSGASFDLYNTLVKEISSAAVLGGGAGQTVVGIMALSENGAVASGPYAASVMRVGNSANTCRPLQQLQ